LRAVLEHQVTHVLLFFSNGSDLMLFTLVQQNVCAEVSLDSGVISECSTSESETTVPDAMLGSEALGSEVSVQRFNSCKKSLKSSKYGQVKNNCTSNFKRLRCSGISSSSFIVNSA